jgi:hypothetical protein
MLKLASSTSPNDGTDRKYAAFGWLLDFENFPLSHTFASYENLHLNGFVGNGIGTQHHLTIQAPETESACHQFFNLKKMGRSWS